MILTLSDSIVAIVAGFIPLLTAAAAHKDASDAQRAAIAIVASGVLAVAQAIVDGGGAFDSRNLLGTFVTVFVVQLASYVGLWKPALAVNERILPNVGIGKPAED